jgi:hypothetical protein
MSQLAGTVTRQPATVPSGKRGPTVTAMARSGGRREPDKHKSHDDAPQPTGAGATQQLLFTLDATTHQVLKVETINRAGARRELSVRQTADLTGADDLESVESAIDEAYEAGVAEGLDEAGDDEDEELALDQLLVEPVAEEPVFRHGVRRLLLRRLLLRRLLRRKLASSTKAPQQRRQPTAHEARNGSASGV